MAETMKSAAGVASAKDNKKLEHVDKDAPVTTRDDTHDLGVPMLPGDAREAVGPEDALGEGPKRGDYRERQPENTTHVEFVPTEDGGEPIRNEDGAIIDFKPMSRPVHQNPRVEQIGDEARLKGGVETS